MADIREFNVVQASDGTFIVRSLSEEGVQTLVTASNFTALVDRLRSAIETPEAPKVVAMNSDHKNGSIN